MTRREQVTIQQVYDIINRLEDKIDHNLEQMGARIGIMEGKMNTIQNALSLLQGKIIGVSAIISLVIAISVAFIKGWVGK